MSTDLVVPALGESVVEVVVAKWLKQVGESIAIDEPVVDLETDKVSVGLSAPAAGVLAEQRFAPGATVKVGEVIGRIDAATATPTSFTASAELFRREPRETETATATAMATGLAGHARSLSPSVRKAIREGAPIPGTPAPAVAAPAGPTGADEEVVPMSPLRKRIAERLVAAQHSAAILTTFNEVDMSAVIALRERFQADFVARHGVKLGFMSLFARACASSLLGFPSLNAEVRGDAIVYKKRFHFGIAVGSGRGLVVPVVRDVDRLSLAAIEQTIAALAQRARDSTLTLDDLAGGTFTLSNGGIYGSLMSTPLLNLPQTGILGMHKIMQRPIAVGAEIKLRPMMYLALSYDHRVADGREAVGFLVGVKERIEAPERLMLDL